MKKMSVLIVSRDTDYCINVSAYFRAHYSESVSIVACYSLSDISEYIKNNNISIILADEDCVSAVKSASAGKCVVFGLVESKSGQDENTVLKYISAPSLYNELLFIYSGIASEDLSDGVINGNIYTFISVNGCGSTTLSAAFARRLASEGKRVLYLGLDGLSDYSSLFSVSTERGMSDIILALKSKTSNVSLVAKSSTYSGDVCFIDKCRCSDDMYEIDDDELELLFDKIISSDSYDAVIMDISFAYQGLWRYVARKAGYIFCVTTNRTTSISKTNNFIETVKIRDVRSNTEASERLCVIVNRCSSECPAAELSCQKQVFVHKYSAEDYISLTRKISQDKAWDEFIKR